MSDISNMLSKIIVIKRDGKKAEFDTAKVVVAIKKGFDSVQTENANIEKYTEKDIYKIYNNVAKKIVDSKKDRIKIDEIQDYIEEALKEDGYEDVYESFSNYRERRNQSRKLFFDEKKQYAFLKAIETLSIEPQNETEIPEKAANSMSSMLKYGQTVAKEYSKSYLLKRKIADAHEGGSIYIHDLEYLPMGTTNCLHIDLNKLFKDGFSTGIGYLREPNNIMTYSILTSIAIQTNQNDQSGEQSIPLLDYYFAPGIVKSFKKEFKQIVYDLLDYTDFGIFAAVNGMEREMDKISQIEFDISIFDTYCRESEQLKRLFRIAYKKALEKTDKLTYQAMEALIHNLNTLRSKAGAEVPDSTVNLGTDTSKEGRMIIKNYLLALDKGIGNNEIPLFPKTIFKVKDGINYKPGDPNYDLFKLACKIEADKQIIIFSFLDAEYNIKNYDENDYITEVAYMGSSVRVYENVVDESKQTSISRGKLSTTTINLPRIGIKHGIVSGKEVDLDGFYEELDNKLDIIKEELLDRFQMQEDKRVYNFPFLIGQANWIDSEKLKPYDRLRRVNKHGTMSIGIMGLSECLVALTGKHHGESNSSQNLGIEIVKHIRNKADEYSNKYKLNFNVFATRNEHILKKFMTLDKSIFGKIKGVTDEATYTKGFDIKENYNISIDDKINIESKYHALTNGGHLIVLDMGSKSKNKEDVYEDTVRKMKEAGIGLGKMIIK